MSQQQLLRMLQAQIEADEPMRALPEEDVMNGGALSGGMCSNCPHCGGFIGQRNVYNTMRGQNPGASSKKIQKMMSEFASQHNLDYHVPGSTMKGKSTGKTLDANQRKLMKDGRERWRKRRFFLTLEGYNKQQVKDIIRSEQRAERNEKNKENYVSVRKPRGPTKKQLQNREAYEAMSNYLDWADSR